MKLSRGRRTVQSDIVPAHAHTALEAVEPENSLTPETSATSPTP